MTDFVKPAVYNPAKAEARIKELEDKNHKLLEENTNLKIKCRILEERLSRTNE